MREIKFKYVFQHEETGYIITKIWNIEEIEKGVVYEYLKQVPRYYVVNRLLYTGLKDKNGEEIYEGGILSIYGCIEWYQSENRWAINILNEYSEIYLHEYEENELEVIGNIYDNPNLLEVQND